MILFLKIVFGSLAWAATLLALFIAVQVAQSVYYHVLLFILAFGLQSAIPVLIVISEIDRKQGGKSND